MDKEMVNHFFRTMGMSFNKCHHPEFGCTEPAIRAHSVQNNGVLSLLADDNHVVMIQPYVPNCDAPPELQFTRISRHKATTFAGLCNRHDTELFRPIDTNRIDTKSPEHLFLIAYRSLVREFHVLCENAIKYQSTYQKLIETGRVSEHADVAPMRIATEQLMLAHTFFRYKSQWDMCYLRKDWTQVVHRVFDIGMSLPTIAACTTFQARQQSNGTDIPSYLEVNVFPQDGRYWAIYSCLSTHRVDAEAEIDRIVQADGYYRKYLISKQLVQRVENFVLAPNFYDSLPEEKVSAIKDYFVRTMMEPDFDSDSEHFYLFKD